jgi:hypothetical protein
MKHPSRLCLRAVLKQSECPHDEAQKRATNYGSIEIAEGQQSSTESGAHRTRLFTEHSSSSRSD